SSLRAGGRAARERGRPFRVRSLAAAREPENGRVGPRRDLSRARAARRRAARRSRRPHDRDRALRRDAALADLGRSDVGVRARRILPRRALHRADSILSLPQRAHARRRVGRANPLRRARAASGVMTKLAFAVLLIATPASAIDPDRAQAHVDEAVRRGDDVFCAKPPIPLRGHARDLCPHASAIRGCEAFERACGELPAPERTVPLWLQGIGKLALVFLFALFVLVVGAGIFALVRARRRGIEEEPEREREAEVVREDVTTESPSALLARANSIRDADPEGALALY